MIKLTNTCGCAIEEDFLYYSQILDSDDSYDEFSRLVFYDAQSPTPWLAHDLKWRVTSVCVWRQSPFGRRLYVALSSEGDIELVGPSSLPHIKEHIPTTGLSRSTSLQKGFMRSVRQIGSRLYACGGGFRVFARDVDSWKDLTSTEDRDASMADGQTYFDINGNNEREVYAVGSDGVDRNRISYFDGSVWNIIDARIDGLLTSLEVTRSGRVYVGGSDGRIFSGDWKKGFTLSGVISTGGGVNNLAQFGDYIYVSSPSGLYRTKDGGRPVEEVNTGLIPKQRDVRNFSVYGGTLWAFCGKDLLCFDGQSWKRIVDPDLS